MPEFQRPVDKVRAALPGTIGEVMAETGYDAGTVAAMLTRLRAEGLPISAVEDGVSRSVSRVIDREDPHTATTIFVVDSSRG